MFTRENLERVPADMTGLVVAISANCLGARWQLPKFQLVRIVGGFGASAENIGRKIFGEHLADNDDFSGSRSNVIGVPTQAQIDEAMADPNGEAPFDPTNMTYLVLGPGFWTKNKVLEEAMAMAKGQGKPLMAFYCHAETQVTDFGGLTFSKLGPAPVEVWRDISIVD